MALDYPSPHLLDFSGISLFSKILSLTLLGNSEATCIFKLGRSKSTTFFIILWDFWDYFDVLPNLFSAIIKNKHDIYELPHELMNNLRFSILEK